MHLNRTYKEIVRRERDCRKEAERLLEEKSLELYSSNQALTVCLKKFEKSTQLLQSVMATVPDSIILTDKNYNIINYNSSVNEMFFYSDGFLVGKNISLLIPTFSDEITQSIEEVENQDIIIAKRRDGNEFPVDIKIKLQNKTKDYNALFIIRDISRRVQGEKKKKEMQQHIDEVRRLEAIGTLSAGIAHEINTPMQFISDNLDYLKSKHLELNNMYKDKYGIFDYKKNTDLNKDIEKISTNIESALDDSISGAEQVRDIVFLIREFSHPGSGGKEYADINAIIKNVTQISYSKYKMLADVTLNLHPNLPEVICRKGQIQQVLLNLFINAIDAVESALNKTDNKHRGSIEITTQAIDGMVSVAISDTGCGIPEAIKEKIFDPFYTTKPVGKGTGQGLALANDIIIVGHQGKISFVDKAEFVTTILISLPIKCIEE